MPVSVLSNSIAAVDRREAIQRAVLEGIGQRAGNWVLRILEPQLRPDYIVKIEGPDGFEWERTFFGPVEQTPELVRDEIASGLKIKT
jgi:hypothetical protein